jgi:hypothetical protein
MFGKAPILNSFSRNLSKMNHFARTLTLLFFVGLIAGCGNSAPTEVVGGAGGIPADIQAEYDRVAAEEAKNAEAPQ